MYFPRLMRDLTLPTDLVLLSQITKNAQMFWNHLSLQLLCNVARDKNTMPLLKSGIPGSGEENFVWILPCYCTEAHRSWMGADTHFGPAAFAWADHVPAAGRQPLSLLETPVQQTCTLTHECHQKTSSKASLWVRSLPDQPVHWDCYVCAFHL